MKTPVLIRIIKMILVFTLWGVTGQMVSGRAADHHVLSIFGNANHDHVIDMRDVTCIELIIQGLRTPDPLADASQDKRVDTLDVALTQQIILGNQSSITLLDETGKPLTIPMPVHRIIPEHITSLEAVRVLGAKQKLVSIGSTAVKESMGSVYLQDLIRLPTIGTYAQPDHEAILSLNPDLVIAYRHRILKEKIPGVALFYGGYGEPYLPDQLATDMIKLGYILDKREQAQAYADWYTGYLDMIKDRIALLSEDEKPKVYVFYPLTGLYKCRGDYPPVEIGWSPSRVLVK
ncbi:MAG: hypothetical protein D3904_01555, partial [Candidatus Electrothrix sp. EH2]|nr:hypothetical protein [Candidatus Electrothrix sp. EH2]